MVLVVTPGCDQFPSLGSVENCKYHFVPCSRSQHLSGAITPDGLASVADARPGALHEGRGQGSPSAQHHQRRVVPVHSNQHLKVGRERHTG